MVSGKEDEATNAAEETDEPSDWAEDACKWAIEKGLFQGGENKSYRWHDSVTREELALILERTSKLSGTAI